MSTSSIAVILTIASTIISAIGGLLFKKASNKLSFKPSKLIKNHNFIFGFVLFGISAALYLVALKQGELNILYPITSLTYVWSLFIGKKHLNEEMNAYKILGVILILLGALIITT